MEGILENTVDFDLQRPCKKKSEGKVYSGVLSHRKLAGPQFRLAFAGGYGTAGRGKKMCVKFGCWRKDSTEVFMWLCF